MRKPLSKPIEAERPRSMVGFIAKYKLSHPIAYKMDCSRRKAMLIILVMLILLLNVFASFRWSYLNIDSGENMRYKIDHWTNKQWVEFYPALALVSAPIEFPLINAIKFDSYNQLEAHVKKHAVTGVLVNEWIERTRLTYLYYGLNSFFMFNIFFLIIMIVKSRKGHSKKSV
ncbi:hypothetical protein [Paenibacillus rigui]|uniref:Uncharacterized protein n=1 Tax=Paenibacillus rigui TaxID=554312 RepID=A0A229UQC8_9BACL|nr:hypothetical protein [Paenibacillus rigui]OXM85079.1 hypothetical protein CF651_15815 [Paenibacillus rigui]